MKKSDLIAILSLLSLVTFWWSQRKGSSVPAVKLGRIETSSSTQAGVVDIVSQAEKLATANEDPAITRLRNDIKGYGVRVTGCEIIGNNRWCSLSNGWKLPSWLVIDYLGLSDN